MRSDDYWRVFLATGAPEAYLLYSQALKMEASDVSDNTGAGPAGRGLQ